MESQDPGMDPEKGRMPKKYLDGLPTLSAFLASSPDLQVFQRFSRLATRNLLYLQAEMADIEARLDHFDADDLAMSRTSNWREENRVQRNAHCWETFRTRAENGDEQERARMDLILQLRKAMAEYQDALIRQSKVLELGVPNPRIRNAIRKWCEEKAPLSGNSRHSYGDISQYDTVPLHTPSEQDRLTLFLEEHLGYHLRYPEGRKGWKPEFEGIHYFPGEVVGRIVSFASIVLSAALLIGAITSLYFVKEPSSVIGLLAAFTTMFAGSVGLLTSARKVEVYAATAAYVPLTSLLDMSDPMNRYAAVLVVFVGNIANEPTKKSS